MKTFIDTEAGEDGAECRPLLRCGASELDDINELVRIYRPTVLRYAMASLRDNDLAESVTQDCFLKAFRSRLHFRGECSIHTWLMAIAKNLIRDYTRTQRFRFWKGLNGSALEVSEVQDRVPGHQSSPEACLLVHEKLERIWDCVDGLTKKQREVFLMRFAREMDLAEIAHSTGQNVNTVKTNLQRGLRRIRIALQASGRSPDIAGFLQS
jgi:RNA polymerase sigma-70 factor, ECF subfamily